MIDQITLAVAHPLRAAIRRLQTRRSAVSPVEKLLRAAAMAVPYSILVLVLAVRSWLGRPLLVPGRTGFGATFTCRLPDLIQMYVWIFDEWEPDLTRFVAGRLADGDAFIDVGANVGYYSLLAAACLGTTGQVVAVEASPVVFDELQRHLVANDCTDRVRAVNKAASATVGTIAVYDGPSSNTGMTTTVRKRHRRAQSTVQAEPLDRLLSAKDVASVRLIKIDVEGAEPDVVAGMANVIRHLPADAEIAIELSPRWWPDPTLRPDDVLRPFTERGFHVYEISNSYLPWRYLWPNAVGDALRVRRELTRRVARLDLVLSRRDADRLPIDAQQYLSRFGGLNRD